MKVKVIILDGVVSDVLSDMPAEVEVIDINKDYRDSDSLRSYADKLFTFPNLRRLSRAV